MNPIDTQFILDRMGTVIRKRRPGATLESAASGFQNALIHLSPTSIRYQSLTDTDGLPQIRACPRDNTAAGVVIDGELKRGWDACAHCISNLRCALSGETALFTLITPCNWEELFEEIDDDPDR